MPTPDSTAIIVAALSTPINHMSVCVHMCLLCPDVASAGQQLIQVWPGVSRCVLGASPGQQLLQGVLEGGSVPLLQPELGVVGVSHVGAAVVEVAVEERPVGLLPVLQRGVHPLHQEVHDPSVGGVSDEQQLMGGGRQGDKETASRNHQVHSGSFSGACHQICSALLFLLTFNQEKNTQQFFEWTYFHEASIPLPSSPRGTLGYPDSPDRGILLLNILGRKIIEE